MLLKKVKWAQYAPIPIKNERNAPIRSPSFVYRQDGYELSYEVGVIITRILTNVKRLLLPVVSAIMKKTKGGACVELWKRQIKLAQYMLLGTVIITVVNVAFLLGNTDTYISYSAALPYYLVWLGKIFDNGWYLGPNNGQYTATGLVMAGVVLAVLLVLWWLAKGSRRWLKVGIWAIGMDLAVLAVLAFMVFSDPMSCFWEAVIHVAVMWEMHQGLKAWKQLDAHNARLRAEQEAAAEEECVL